MANRRKIAEKKGTPRTVRNLRDGTAPRNVDTSVFDFSTEEKARTFLAAVGGAVESYALYETRAGLPGYPGTRTRTFRARVTYRPVEATRIAVASATAGAVAGETF